MALIKVLHLTKRLLLKFMDQQGHLWINRDVYADGGSGEMFKWKNQGVMN